MKKISPQLLVFHMQQLAKPDFSSEQLAKKKLKMTQSALNYFSRFGITI